jgi:hypothetical protein
MGRVAPRANLHSVRLSWVAADIRPIRDSRRRLAASNNRERKKSLRTLQGQFRLPRLSGNHHRVRCSAQMDSRANTCVAPQLDQFISRAGWRTGSASPRRARRQRVAVVRYAQPELNRVRNLVVPRRCGWERLCPRRFQCPDRQPASRRSRRCAPRGHWEHSLGSASTALLRSI